jgi:hypothetical protein
VPQIRSQSIRTWSGTSAPRANTLLLRRLNERRILDAILTHGPLSRTALREAAAMAGPTVTRAADALLRIGLIEELESEQVPGRLGRPEKRLRLASHSTAVIGVVVDARRCTVVPAGLDGRHADADAIRFETPDSYPELLSTLERICRELATIPAPAERAAQRRKAVSPGVRGVGISVPGLVSNRLDEVVLSPNLHLLDRHAPARDLERRQAAHRRERPGR